MSVRVPKRQITAFVGVSGSGKSSLVFDTIAAEAQRQLNETFSAFVRGFLPKLGQPDADLIENLSTAIVVDQKRLGGGSRSTLGTVTDINSFLRLLFSRRSTPHVGYGYEFSFNEPQGMCPGCNGIGREVQLDHGMFFDRTKSLNEGAILHRDFAVDSWYWHIYAQSGRFDNDKPLRDYTDEEWQLLLYGADEKVALAGPGRKSIKIDFEGVETKFNRLYIAADEDGASERKRETVARYTTSVRCPECAGTRLAEAARTATVDGHTLPAVLALDLVDLHALLPTLRTDAVAPLVDEATARVGALIDMGLGYLTLDRETSTLSGGESQRIKMVRHLGSSLVDVMYVFDEPTIGLHPRDVGRMNALLHRLRDKGNTVLVVEHDTDVITAADHVVELGPRAGTDGGRIVYEGDVAGLATSGTLTGEFLHRPVTLQADRRTPTGQLRADERLGQQPARVRRRRPARRARRAHRGGRVGQVHAGPRGAGAPAPGRDRRRPDAGGHLDPLHPGHLDRRDGPDPQALRQGAPGSSPALFSFNSEGACPTCNGLGVVYSDLAFLDGVRSTCTDCGGRRYTEEVLALTVDGKSISDALDLTAADAVEFFAAARHPAPAAGRRRRRAGLPDARPAAVHAVRRRVPAAQAGRAAARGGQHLRARRADHRAAHVRLRAPAGAARPARRRRQLGDRRRAQPRRHRARRLGDRPRPRRRRRRRRGGVRGTPAELVHAPGSFTGEHLARHVTA